MSTRISYYAETAPRGSRLRRRRRREEKRIRKRARLAHHTSPRVQHTALVPPAHSSSTRPPSRYETPQRSTREMSIRGKKYYPAILLVRSSNSRVSTANTHTLQPSYYVRVLPGFKLQSFERGTRGRSRAVGVAGASRTPTSHAKNLLEIP